MSRTVHALTLFLCLAAVVQAQPTTAIYTGPGTVDNFVAKDASAAFVSADAAGVTFKTSKGMVRVTGPYLTYQDDQGKWQPAKPRIVSDNAGGWKQSGTAVEVSLIGGGPNKRLRLGKGATSWELSLDGAGHAKDNEFSFATGGQAWTLQILPYGSSITTKISKKQGAKTYSFTHHPGAQPVSVDPAGNLLVGKVTTTRAIMIGADRKVYPCGPWTADKSSISFTCDDKELPAQAVPYIIDPTSTEVGPSSMQCDGQFSRYDGWDGTSLTRVISGTTGVAVQPGFPRPLHPTSLLLRP